MAPNCAQSEPFHLKIRAQPLRDASLPKLPIATVVPSEERETVAPSPVDSPKGVILDVPKSPSMSDPN